MPERLMVNMPSKRDTAELIMLKPCNAPMQACHKKNTSNDEEIRGRLFHHLMRYAALYPSSCLSLRIVQIPAQGDKEFFKPASLRLRNSYFAPKKDGIDEIKQLDIPMKG